MKKEKYSSVKIFGLEGLHENTNIKFTDTGITLSVGLAVEEHISKILNFNQIVTGFTGKVYKTDQRFMYRHYHQIPSHLICAKSIMLEQSNLLARVQYDINLAKSKYHASVALNLLLKLW